MSESYRVAWSLLGILELWADMSLRNLDADDNDARMVAVKYRGLLGCFG